MSAYLELLGQVRNLPGRILKNPDAQDAFANLLGAVLALEGPPPFPLEGEFKWEVIRTRPKNRKVGSPRFAAATWRTGTWTCLLMMRESVPMGRGTKITLGDGSSTTTPHDSASGTAMDHIRYAVEHFGLTSSGQAALMCNSGRFRTFIAWRPLYEWEPMDRGLKGDADNYLKTVADALSLGSYRVFRNDRDVARMVSTKLLYEGWDRPAGELMPALLEGEVQACVRKGMDLVEIHAATGMTWKSLGEYLPDAKRKTRKAGKTKVREVSEAERVAVEEGLRLLRADPKLSLPDAAVKAGVGSKILRKALRPKLVADAREAILRRGASMKEAAAIARMTAPGLKYQLKDDQEVQKAISDGTKVRREGFGERGVAAKRAKRAKPGVAPQAAKRVRTKG